MSAFWEVALCSLVEVDRRFIRAYYLHFQGDASIIDLMVEAVHASQTLVCFDTTRISSQKARIIILSAVRTLNLKSEQRTRESYITKNFIISVLYSILIG
jgi:hypothetical protein